MPRRRLRAALAVAVAAPLLIGPVGAEAAGSVALTCRTATQSGSWQRLPVTFRPVPSVQTRDVLTSYSLDPVRPQRVLVTNGNTIRVSDSHGCSFRDSLVLGAQPAGQVPLSGITSTVVATASLPAGPSLALVREGTGPASRPHVLRSGNAAPGTWAETSAGLPVQGSPRLLEPANAVTAYLTLTPATDSGGNGGTLPTLPGVGGDSAGPAGLLYATTDGGRSWSLRTPASAVPGGITGFDALAVDVANPNLLYALAGGRLVVSRDGGRTLAVSDEVAGATAVEPMEAGEVAVFVGASQVLHSKDGGRSFQGRPAPAGVGSAAYRKGDGGVVVEAEGRLLRVDVRGRSGTAMIDAGIPATKGSARGDRAEGGSFHATSGNLLLRYVDPRPVGEVIVPRAPGDIGTPPPPPGTMSPASRSVRMPVGESQALDFTLALPESPTPLDMYLLVDTSESMKRVINDLKANLVKATKSIKAEGIDLRVGIGAIGIGPREGEDPYPEIDPKENYKKPTPYTRIREVGEVNEDLLNALRSMSLTTPPSRREGNTAEGQLIALQQMVTGRGILEPNSIGALPSFRVAPGQDAGFRQAGGVRHIVVQATNEAFQDPYGTPMTNGRPDVEGIARLLASKGIKHVGLAVVENGESKVDLGTLSRLTGTLAPPGGVDCGDYVYLREGEPLVCDSSSNFSSVMARLVKSLADRQSVSLVTRGETPLVGGIDAGRLRDLDVTKPNTVPFRVQVSCVDRAAGSYTQSLDAVMRGYKVATARLDVTCTPLAAGAAAVPPRPQPPAVQDPAPPAQPAQAPAVPAPAPPVVQAQAQAQVQSQVQAQAQVQPLTAAALQQQEELQLALALLSDERGAPGTELAMVDRRRSEELRALALLSLSMGAASAVGLARLRTRRAEAVRVHRVS